MINRIDTEKEKEHDRQALYKKRMKDDGRECKSAISSLSPSFRTKRTITRCAGLYKGVFVRC